MSQQASLPGTTRAGDGSKHTPTIRIVRGDDDLRAVGALRYRVYVQEMGRDEPHADHVARTVIDPEDQRAIVLAAFDAFGEAIGTVRLQSSADMARDELLFHGFETMPDELRCRSSLTAKLITDKDHRRGVLTTRLILGVFRSGYEHDYRLNLINCNPPLDGFFARFGFVDLGLERRHPIYGEVRVMALPMADAGFFEAIGSPFAPLVGRLGPDPSALEAVRAWMAGCGLRYWEDSAVGRPM